jgi:2-methylisocitrate lyase-like PEP mutase family enzyme
MGPKHSLLDVLNKDELVVAPGAYDMVSAKLIEKNGFKAVYMTGNGQVASRLGLPDLGFVTMSEMLEQARNTVRSVRIPVIADVDDGYGSLLALKRMVIEFEAAGVSAIQLEDQVSPKKCGHELGRQVVEANEMVRKIEMVLKTRQSKEFLLIVRTDTRTSFGFEEALSRGKLYESSGADVIFIESPESVEELKKIGSSFSVPVMANMVEGGRTPLLSASELMEFGFSLVIFPISTILAAIWAVDQVLGELKNSGTPEKYRGKMLNLEQYHKLLKFHEYRDMA